MSLTDAQQTHIRVMREVLRFVQDTPLVLKGGTGRKGGTGSPQKLACPLR